MAAAARIVCDQSILVSGESGAGKTVTTKHIMKYLAGLSQRKADHFKRRRAPSPGRGEGTNGAPPRREMSMRRVMTTQRAQSWRAGAQIEEKILESNPILEAFGNARTIRNDNSSRFGKFVELQFKESGSLMGAAIETYLLEKVRLIHQMPGERNYHIFYEMVAAATKEERKQYHLDDYTIRDFRMTNASGTYDRRDGADDAELFDKLAESMTTMGFDVKMQEDIFRVTMAFLHASNVTFDAVTDDSSKVDESNPHLGPVLTLFGLRQDDFQSAMCQFDIGVGNTSYTRTVNKDLAAKGLEALIKKTYGALFDFIVQTVNKKIDYRPMARKKAGGTGGGVGVGDKSSYIGVLDIFGFESFPKNSFEQLCINYCNEALQQQFNLHIFKTEQEEYRREGIQWDHIDFPDNQDVIELIYHKKESSGIFSYLADQCKTARGNDKSFADAMYKGCGSHARFRATALHKGRGQFLIHHYAGPVLYGTEGFVEKNKDEIPRGAASLLENSSNEFVQLLGKISAPSPPSAAAGGGGVRASGGPKKRPTVGGQFALQLAELRRRIDQTSPHYIRCLKPNDLLQPELFVDAMIADQLRYAGVLEAIRVSRVGYSQRYGYEIFVNRYRFIAMEAADDGGGDGDIAERVDRLAHAVAIKIYRAEHPNEASASPPPLKDLLGSVGIQRGKTKVFLRQRAFEYLERFRSQRLSQSAVLIQSLGRRFLCRCRYLRAQYRIVVAQSCGRRFLARRLAESLRGHRSATHIQGRFRLWHARRTYASKRAAARWCQRMLRGRRGRERYLELYEAHQEEMALNKLRYESAVVLQCWVRRREARAIREVLEAEREEEEGGDDLEEELALELSGRGGGRGGASLSSHDLTDGGGGPFFLSSNVDANTVMLLREARTKAALQADKAQAVAKQTKQDAGREVEVLRKQLETALLSVERERQVRDELEETRAEVVVLRNELEGAWIVAEKARDRVSVVEAENKRLREELKAAQLYVNGGGGVAGGVGVGAAAGGDATMAFRRRTTTRYDDHADLKQLDDRIFSMTMRAKQGRKDLEMLVQSLAILK